MIRVSPERATLGLVSVLGCMIFCFAPAVQAQSTAQGRSTAGSIVTLEAPLVTDYWVSASRQTSGVIVFDGYAPDAATTEALSTIDGVDVSYLQLARGAPDSYRAAIDYGMSVLSKLSEGRFALRGVNFSVTGTASTSEDYAALLAVLAQPLPRGVTLATAEISAPRAKTYTWTATKSASGTIHLSGLVPSLTVEAELVAGAGQGATAVLTYASGEPNNFVASAKTGLSLLRQLNDGSLTLDGSNWLLTGTPGSVARRTAIEVEFTSRGLAAQGWSIAMSDPVPATTVVAVEPPQPTTAPVPDTTIASPAEPTVDTDYAFSARSSATGAVILSGQLPADSTVRFFSVITKGDTAAISIADGAPATFLPSAEIGLRALLQLNQAELDFAAGKWQLTGTAPDAATRDAIIASISADTGPEWTTDIALATPAVAPISAPSGQSKPAAPAGVPACRAPLADFSALNAILFRSGVAVIAAESSSALDELAEDLSACPEAIVHIEGHTDTDGDDQQNLALSVARAEAVVKALVERQVNPDRLYAIGYGESNPIASNDTAEGKRENRRIVITITDESH